MDAPTMRTFKLDISDLILIFSNANGEDTGVLYNASQDRVDNDIKILRPRRPAV
jgi:hypothetical protein